MTVIDPALETLLNPVAMRHGFALDAVRTLYFALRQGGGQSAQFNHPGLGGMGQWMRGGMVMIGDMFNNNLKSRVDRLCYDLADLAARQPPPPPPPSWWPAELGCPSTSGAQNNLRYAYFPAAHRLAIDLGGRLVIHDTLDHQIGGVSQQQGSNTSLTFTSQYGHIALSSLPIISPKPAEAAAVVVPVVTKPAEIVQQVMNQAHTRAESAAVTRPTPAPLPAPLPAPHPASAPAPSPAPETLSAGTAAASDADQDGDGGVSESSSQIPRGAGAAQSSEEIIAAIAALGKFKEQGLINEREFNRKKRELLERL